MLEDLEGLSEAATAGWLRACAEDADDHLDVTAVRAGIAAAEGDSESPWKCQIARVESALDARGQGAPLPPDGHGMRFESADTAHLEGVYAALWRAAAQQRRAAAEKREEIPASVIAAAEEVGEWVGRLAAVLGPLRVGNEEEALNGAGGKGQLPDDNEGPCGKRLRQILDRARRLLMQLHDDGVLVRRAKLTSATWETERRGERLVMVVQHESEGPRTEIQVTMQEAVAALANLEIAKIDAAAAKREADEARKAAADATAR